MCALDKFYHRCLGMNPRHQLLCRKNLRHKQDQKRQTPAECFATQPSFRLFVAHWNDWLKLCQLVHEGTQPQCVHQQLPNVCVWALQCEHRPTCHVCACAWEREREGGETITRTTTSTLWKKYHGKQPARWVLHCYRQTPSVHLTSAGWLAVANPGIPKKEGQTVNILQISPETQPDNTKHGISHRTAAANEYPPVPRSPATISADKKINGIVKTKSLILSSDFWSLLSTGQTMLWEG